MFLMPASELLSGKRRMAAGMAHTVSIAWHIPAGLLIAPHGMQKAA